MAALLVTFRLVVSSSYEQNLAFLQTLKTGSGGCVRLTENCYVMDTNESPAAVYDALRRHLHKNDLLLVMRVGRPYFGQHSREVVDWLNLHL